MDLRVSPAPPSDCMWGPAGCPGRSCVSIQGRGPTPRTAPSGSHTAGHSRSELSRLRWFLSLGHLRTGSPRSGRLYLFRERVAGQRKRHINMLFILWKKVLGCRVSNAVCIMFQIFHLIKRVWSVWNVLDQINARCSSVPSPDLWSHCRVTKQTWTKRNEKKV